MVLFEEENVERAESGETELSLIALEYNGPRSSKAVRTMRDQGQWPGTSPVLSSVRYVALVPDEGLGYLEATSDVEVYYDAEAIAKGLLQRNYLPSTVFGREMDNRVQQRVLDALGIEFQGIENEEGNREELRQVANVDEGGDEVDEPDEGANPRVEELTDNHTRNDLLDAATDLGMSADDTEKDSVSSALKRECAEYLASLDDQSKVNDALSEDEESEESEE